MKIHTYFEPIKAHNVEDETRLILLWQDNWRAMGWEPHVLNEHVARRHPLFAEFYASVSALPTVNPPEYERSCYLRWLAMAEVGGGIMADFDCFNRALPLHTRPIPKGIVLWEHISPSLVSGAAEDYLAICRSFMAYQPDEKDLEGTRPHLSDQNVLRRLAPGCFTVDESRVVRLYGSPDWQKGRAIHFSTGSMTPVGKIPKWKHVEALMKGCQ